MFAHSNINRYYESRISLWLSVDSIYEDYLKVDEFIFNLLILSAKDFTFFYNF